MVTVKPHLIATRLVGLAAKAGADDAGMSNLRMSINVGDYPIAIGDGITTLVSAGVDIPAPLLAAIADYRDTLTGRDRDSINLPVAAA